MRISIFRVTLMLLYAVGFAAVIAVGATGWHYYTLPLGDRPHADLHAWFKPGGPIGHGLGIIGSTMMIVLFVYSLRKRRVAGLRFGRMNRWLDIHIWLGIMGPLFITLHTAFKFNGLVSISYYSMMAVMLSGFFGRYIFMQIPRDETGLALSVEEIDARLDGLSAQLADRHNFADDIRDMIIGYARVATREGSSHISVLARTLMIDLVRPLRAFKLRRTLHRQHPELPALAIKAIVQIARQRSRLMRRKSALQTMTSVFHLWHVIHKPFAVVMIVIMIVHVAVTVLMGYTWIF